MTRDHVLDHYADRVYDLIVTHPDEIVVIDGDEWNCRELGLLVDRAAAAEEHDPEPDDMLRPGFLAHLP